MSILGVVLVKGGVQFTKIAPAGFRILSAIDQCSKALSLDLTITSACDGEHSGPDDPHHKGEAYDIRSHDFPNESLKQMVLDDIMRRLGFESFYGFLEASGTDNEHIHIQRKKDTIYP